MCSILIDCSHGSADALNLRIINEYGSRTAQLDAENAKATLLANADDDMAEYDYSETLNEIADQIVEANAWTIEDNSLFDRCPEPDANVCTDCLMVIENGDSSGIDDADVETVLAAVAQFGNATMTCRDDSGHFSWRWCDCCNRPLGGDRFGVTFL